MRGKMDIRTICKRLSVVILCCAVSIVVEASQTSYQESAAEVMINSLAEQPQQSFLNKLYTQLLFVPIWTKEEGLSPLSIELFDMMDADQTLDRASKLYLDAIRLRELTYEKYTEETNLSEKVKIEFKISQLYKGYADHTLYGSINWGAFLDKLHNQKAEGIISKWVTYKPKTDPVSLLEKAVMSGSLKSALQESEPTDYHYAALREQLKIYLTLQENGGWMPIVSGSAIRPRQSDKVIPDIRKRLKITGEAGTCTQEDETYDACLQEAVEKFQSSHGLTPDGVIGKSTVTAMNVSVAQRINTIRLNLDRIKWLNQRHASRHIIINIPAFMLTFEENGSLLKQMKVITGTPRNPTPIFSNSVQYIVLNPYWNVPKSIIQNEMIPKLLKNPNAMVKEGIEIYAGQGDDARKISGASVDWSQYRYAKSMPFRFAQPPGHKNALGKIKFLFPNEFSVYMHDTPTKPLFSRDVRAFSHGCVRLGEPVELLKIFSGFNDNVDFEKAKKRMQGNSREYLKLQTQAPIDIVYLTAWVDYDGVLQFRDDIYGYDAMQLSAIRQW